MLIRKIQGSPLQRWEHLKRSARRLESDIRQLVHAETVFRIICEAWRKAGGSSRVWPWAMTHHVHSIAIDLRRVTSDGRLKRKGTVYYDDSLYNLLRLFELNRDCLSPANYAAGFTSSHRRAHRHYTEYMRREFGQQAGPDRGLQEKLSEDAKGFSQTLEGSVRILTLGELRGDLRRLRSPSINLVRRIADKRLAHLNTGAKIAKSPLYKDVSFVVEEIGRMYTKYMSVLDRRGERIPILQMHELEGECAELEVMFGLPPTSLSTFLERVIRNL